MSLAPRIDVQEVFWGEMPKRENGEGAEGVWESCKTDISLTSGEERQGREKVG